MSTELVTIEEGAVFTPVFCDGDGAPVPEVSWWFRGAVVSLENTLDFTEPVTRWVNIFIFLLSRFKEFVDSAGVRRENTLVTFQTFMGCRSYLSMWTSNTNLHVRFLPHYSLISRSLSHSGSVTHHLENEELILTCAAQANPEVV